MAKAGCLAILALLMVAVLTGLPAYAASTPAADLRDANALVQQALAAARQGDLGTAQQTYAAYEDRWFDIEDGIRGASRDSYVAIEKDMSAVSAAFSASPPDQATVVSALSALDAEQQRFLSGAAPTSTALAPTEKSTVATLVDQLSAAQAALASNNYPAAAASLQAFEATWLDVEGEVKTRSADDYRQTETDMQLATTLASQSSPETAAVVDRMAARLAPYREAQRYGVFDAAIILLREGLEALLVIAALSAVLRKSGTTSGQAWLWLGALGGLGLSVILGLAIQAFFGQIVNPANRELMEGVIGLFAACMLIYVSYWLHTKATLSGWQSYISSQTRDALKGGRLVGIAILAFLAVFREGAETALFYLGMVGNITNADLLVGLAIGFGGLLVLGFLLVVVGVRIPMRPFFTIASVLVFYLCFKFIGTGIHALQVSGYIPSASAAFLPSLDAIGLYPTWPTTIAQFVLLALATWVLLRDRARRSSRIAGLVAVAGLVAIGLVGAALAFASPPAAVSPPVRGSASSDALAAVPPAPVLTSTRNESRRVAIPRLRLEQVGAALHNDDVPAARTALEAYDAEWNGIEVYVNFRSRDLYGEIESRYQADITSALNAPDPDTAQILVMLQSMLGKYDEAIRLSDTGAPLSPIFDDLATVRTARAPLRTVGPALQSGDAQKAAVGFAEFKARWPSAQPLFAKYAPDAQQQTQDALQRADTAMTSPGADSAAAVDALLTSYNAGVNVINTAARDAGYVTS